MFIDDSLLQEIVEVDEIFKIIEEILMETKENKDKFFRYFISYGNDQYDEYLHLKKEAKRSHYINEHAKPGAHGKLIFAMWGIESCTLAEFVTEFIKRGAVSCYPQVKDILFERLAETKDWNFWKRDNRKGIERKKQKNNTLN